MSFDKKAKNWDTEKRKERVSKITKKMKKYINLKSTNSAMEFGCGTGLISFNLKDIFDEITLVDSSEGMIDVVKEKIKSSGVENMVPIHMEEFTEEFMEKRFDAIYTSMVMHHIKDIKGILNNLHTLLEDGGSICIVDLDTEDGSFHPPESGFDGHLGFDQGDLKKTLEEIGYTNIKSETFFNGKKERDGKTIKYSMFIMSVRK
ncbi:MAG: class I SAM-dependent DNA methyltransferase [Fusobacteriota bacterium]